MTSALSKFITKTLCDNEGCLDFRSLEERITKSFTVAESVLRSVLFDEEKIAIMRGSQKASAAQITSPDSLIVAKTSLRICQKRAGECAQCDALHLCRFYVCGACMFGVKCKKPHTLASTYNATVLKKHGLLELSEKQLFQLLLQNDPSLLPEICSHYNKGNGVHGSCNFSTSCKNLHICQHYLQGDCKFGSSCKRAHSFDAGGVELKGFSQENKRILLKIYINQFIIMGHYERPSVALPALPEVRNQTPQSLKNATGSSPSPAGANKSISDADRNEICLFFIRRHCSFKDKCVRAHYHLPYRWQFLDSDGVTWKDLFNMEDIEKAYCDPRYDTSCTDPPPASASVFTLLYFQSASSPREKAVNFLTMTYGGRPVRRLSTASSVTKPPHFVLTTQWLWYWKDQSGIWKEFGKQGDGDTSASLSSETLENVYLADREVDITFSAGKHQYILYFKDPAGSQQMYQQNIKHNTKREVRRRPRFVSAHAVEDKLKSVPSPSSTSSTTECVPAHWDKAAVPDFGYRLVCLSSSAKEYNMIAKMFMRTMPQGQINKIQRIQNPSLWKVFQWQKEQMKERNGGKPVNEQYLFHGTDESLIGPICEQNFDWRICGVHGTSYGKGSYFARDASYSDRYARATKGPNRVMFVALILVGDYCKGSRSYVRPPAKGTSRTFYDSCVDSEKEPSIFVVFDKQQIYPEYVIHYS